MYPTVLTAAEFKTELGFNPYDPIMKVFASEEILLQRSVLSCRIGLNFPKHKLATEVDEIGHKVEMNT